VPMLAHIENVSHAHPHPAGTPWELIAVIAVAVIGVAFVLRLILHR